MGLPSGRTSGQGGGNPFAPPVTRALGKPPSAGTCIRPMDCGLADGAKTIVPSDAQLAPKLLFATPQIVTGEPPGSRTFFNWRSAKNPSHCPSGEKNGVSALSIPAM